MVRRAVEVAQGIVDGNPPAETTILIPSELVTRDTVDEYAGW
jgi:ribose transport system substrate-binding protein